jgi:Skp family chaperone for outer membrane proteins
VAACITGSTVLAQNAPAAGGGYKIGVVDMQALIADYPKRQQRYDSLQQQVDALQGEIDKMLQGIEQQVKSLEASAATMTEEQRVAARNKIEQDRFNYRMELDKRQRMIDNQEEEVLKEVLGDINKAVSQIAASENFHLILNSRGGSRGSVVWFSPTIDVTSRVEALLK